jgi:hypothetical protein
LQRLVLVEIERTVEYAEYGDDTVRRVNGVEDDVRMHRIGSDVRDLRANAPGVGERCEKRRRA